MVPQRFAVTKLTARSAFKNQSKNIPSLYSRKVPCAHFTELVCNFPFSSPLSDYLVDWAVVPFYELHQLHHRCLSVHVLALVGSPEVASLEEVEMHHFETLESPEVEVEIVRWFERHFVLVEAAEEDFHQTFRPA